MALSTSCGLLLLLFSLQAVILVPAIRSAILNGSLVTTSFDSLQKDAGEYGVLQDCQNCHNEKHINITVTYMDASGNVQIYKVNSRDLSSSWVWKNSREAIRTRQEGQEGSSQQAVSGLQDSIQPSNGQNQQAYLISPVKLKRQKLRLKRKEKRISQLIQISKGSLTQMRAAAIERSRQFKNSVKGKYSIWRKEYQNPLSDSTLKLMKYQIIMAKVYASIAGSKDEYDLYNSLMTCIKESQLAIGEANSDSELQWSAFERAKAMGHALSKAKELLPDSALVSRKLRAMIQFTEQSITAVKKQSTFLVQHAAKTIPKPLHCLPLQLTTDYFLHNYTSKELPDKDRLEDPTLYHYAIFSDNVLATSVVVNSTVVHAKEPEKHVFHIVTDRLNFAAMKMWFIAHPPLPATVQVENIDEFKWLNSSYCSVLRQLESARIKEYYFKANHPSSLSDGNENLKYRNPKYLSMLNHLRFYMPEVYPKLDKILFLDDDVVVQKDLTPLWSIDMKGMVNGAVETCKESFHRFETYLNFSNPKISESFDPQACGWAFGMNIFDLKEWKKRNITGIYHYWQDLNAHRQLWKLGSLPPGLITFYNLTYPLDRSWHVLGLGYDPAVNTTEIDNAAVVHYNGNYKPWLDLVITKYKSYWSKYVNFDNPYIQMCYINQ